LRHLFADSVYNGANLRDALVKFGNWTVEIVKRAADAAGFQLLPRRWVVERTLARLNRNRRLAKDFEASIASAKAWVYSPRCSSSLGDWRERCTTHLSYSTTIPIQIQTLSAMHKSLCRIAAFRDSGRCTGTGWFDRLLWGGPVCDATVKAQGLPAVKKASTYEVQSDRD
jgi:hypothetical protein